MGRNVSTVLISVESVMLNDGDTLFNSEILQKLIYFISQVDLELSCLCLIAFGLLSPSPVCLLSSC